ncbi:MAG: hypothetical protein ACPGVB_12325 [Chitinophagales bacterium]
MNSILELKLNGLFLTSPSTLQKGFQFQKKVKKEESLVIAFLFFILVGRQKREVRFEFALYQAINEFVDSI